MKENFNLHKMRLNKSNNFQGYNLDLRVITGQDGYSHKSLLNANEYFVKENFELKDQ